MAAGYISDSTGYRPGGWKNNVQITGRSYLSWKLLGHGSGGPIYEAVLDIKMTNINGESTSIYSTVVTSSGSNPYTYNITTSFTVPNWPVRSGLKIDGLLVDGDFDYADIEYAPNGGAGTSRYSYGAVRGTSEQIYTRPSNTFTRVGYAFSGWRDWYNSLLEPNRSYDLHFPHGAAKSVKMTAQWTRLTYSITYNLNESTYFPVTGIVSNAGSYNVETPTIDFGLGNLARAGWTFNRFSPASIPKGSTGDRTVNLFWNPITYSGRLDGEYFAKQYTSNSTNTHYPYRFYTWGAAVGNGVDAVNLTRTGYKFIRIDFTRGSDAGGPAPVFTKESNTSYIDLPPGSYGNIDMTSVWEANKYTIKFNSQGGSSVSDKSATYDVAIGALTTPTRTGYIFNGWFTASSGGTKLEATTKNLSSVDGATVNVYAQWTPITYTVAFNSQGGSAVSSKSAIYDVELGTLVTPTLTGYIFNGWFTASSGGTLITSSSKNLTAEQGATITLYAQWTPITYTVAFNSQGGSPESNKSMTYDKTFTQMGHTISTPTRTGYIFNGWFTAASGGSQITSASKNLTSTQGVTITLYAQWTAISYTIKFDSKGGSAVTDKSMTYDKTFAEMGYTLPHPTRAGYKFINWTAGDSVLSSASKNLTTTANAILTYSANWTPNILTVKYISDGVTHGTQSTGSFDGNISIISNPFTKTGYTFTSWSNSDQAADVKTLGAATYSVNKLSSTIANTDESNVTINLTAQWTINQYKVEFIVNDISTIDSTTVTENYNTSIANRVLTYEGFNFDGWYTAETGGIKQTFPFNLPAHDVKLYARWTAKTYTVKVVNNSGSAIPDRTYNTSILSENKITVPTPTRVVEGKKYSFARWAFVKNTTRETSTIVGTTVTVPAQGYGAIEIKPIWTVANRQVYTGSTVMQADKLKIGNESVVRVYVGDNPTPIFENEEKEE